MTPVRKLTVIRAIIASKKFDPPDRTLMVELAVRLGALKQVTCEEIEEVLAMRFEDVL